MKIQMAGKTFQVMAAKALVLTSVLLLAACDGGIFGTGGDSVVMNAPNGIDESPAIDMSPMVLTLPHQTLPRIRIQILAQRPVVLLTVVLMGQQPPMPVHQLVAQRPVHPVQAVTIHRMVVRLPTPLMQALWLARRMKT